jgi:alpha-amylase/alpha-mannosidase (GH57 family)
MHKRYMVNIILVLAMIGGILSACAKKPDTSVLYVNLTWHQHQPLYYKDAEGNYSRPWVRVHATKDYLDMVETVAKYEGVHVTFNLTPSLIRQLDDFSENGVKDVYWILAEKPASNLTDADKLFILQRFFDANWDHIIRVHPRYSELLDKRAGTDEAAITKAIDTFSEQDFRDLQVWFNLAWVDPDYLAVEPLKSLVEKERNFSEEDKVILFDEILKLVQKVISTHADLQKKGVIEVTTTPYAHPILPLIYDTDLALVGNPGAEMPEHFSYPNDAEYHLAKSVEMYESHFGKDVRGLWPGEGSVAQDIVGLVANAGYKWMQTGEPVLAKSLSIDTFTRDSQELVQQADDLYRPYYVTDDKGNQVGIFFRDWTLSDKIGFTYSGMSGEAAADDLIGRLEAIQSKFIAEGTAGSHVVTLVIDGENAWENYDNDGKLFLNSLYQKFAESTVLKTVTPSEYLKMFPEQRKIDDLFPGAWFSANYDTWIGESEEALAWNYLGEVRTFLADYENNTQNIDQDALKIAKDFMYLAEGSDWFWWYGTDQDSGQDSYFDQGYRELLKSVYTSLGEEPPAFLDVAIIQPQPVKATIPMMGSGTPEIDGAGDDEAWTWAAVYEGGDDDLVTELSYVLDKDNIYFKLDGSKDALTGKSVEFYLTIPRQEGRTSFSMPNEGESGSILGISATTMVQWDPVKSSVNLFDTDGETWSLKTKEIGQGAYGDKSLEIKVPLAALGELVTGDDLRLVSLITPEKIKFPADGPVQIIVLAMGEATLILVVDDPEGDDDGPGTYTYPTDGIFIYQAFDVKSFEISYDATSLIFTMSFYGTIGNGWGSPNGFSVQTYDVYIDKDPGNSTGARMLLPGRNAALAAENGWEFAAWIEGWTPQVVVPDPVTLEPKDYSEATSGMKLFVDPGKNAIIARIPLALLGGGDPADWAYAAVLLGQEGYPATGVWRVRDVNQKSEAYKFGGAPADNNHTRIIDLVWPADVSPTQAEILSGYVSTINSADSLSVDDFAIIPLLTIK